MQDETTNTYGQLTTTTSSSSGSSSTTETVYSGLNQVTGGQIRHGNFHSPLAWSYRTANTVYLNGSVQTVGRAIQRTYQGVVGSSAGVTTASIEAAIGRANNAAFNQTIDVLYGKLRQNTDIGSSAAEAYSERAARKGRAVVNVANRARLSTKSIAKAWLSAKFQWLPLLGDIFAICQEATGTMTRKGFTITCGGQASEALDPMTLSINGVSYGKVTPTGQAEVSCRGKFRFVVNPHLDQAARLTSLDPFVIAWNLIPYSFVVDYFYNVGGYLRDMETAAMYKSAFKGGYITTRTRVNTGIQHYGVSNDKGWQCSVNSSVTLKRASRQVYTNLPKPGRPEFTLDIGSTAMFNIAALLRNALR